MEEILAYIDNLKIGKVQKHSNMAIAPLVVGNLQKGRKLKYFTLEEAVEKGLNIQETGTVGNLSFENNTGKPVLMLQGDYVQGGKQNRMLTRNVYMAKGYKGTVPVNCVQQHRWSHTYEPSFYAGGKRASYNVACAASRGQNAVWNEVDTLQKGLGVESQTADFADIHVNRKGDISEYIDDFEYVEGTVGIVTVIDDGTRKNYRVDIFDQAGTMEKSFEKLLESYAVEAIKGGNKVKKPKAGMKKFVENIGQCGFNEKTPVSLGRDYDIKGKGVEGSGLVYNSRPVYVSFGTKNPFAGIDVPATPLPIPRPHPFLPIRPYGGDDDTVFRQFDVLYRNNDDREE